MFAGFGARLAVGCNLAAFFFTGIPQFSLHAGFFALATAAGSRFGARFTMLPIFRIPEKLQKVSAAKPLVQDADRAARCFRLGMLMFAGFVMRAIARAFDAPKLGLAAPFGLAFGLIIKRAQVCFTSAFRDLWLAVSMLAVPWWEKRFFARNHGYEVLEIAQDRPTIRYLICR